LRVSWNRDLMSSLPSVWFPKNRASSSVPLQAYAAIDAPSTEMPVVIVLPSAAFISAMYLADYGNGVAVFAGGVVTASEVLVASLVLPPEQTETVPRAIGALIPTNRVRRCFFM
jgi:hypothetical protein